MRRTLSATMGRIPPVVGKPLLAAVHPQARRRGYDLPSAMGVFLKTGRTPTHTGAWRSVTRASD